jgi:hypothetical protein
MTTHVVAVALSRDTLDNHSKQIETCIALAPPFSGSEMKRRILNQA